MACAVGAVLVACTAPRGPETAFVLPTLKVDELRRLVTDANRDGVDAVRVFARVLCEAKGLRLGGEAFDRCETRLQAAARANPNAVDRARDLAQLAERLAEATGQSRDNAPAPELSSLCYDLARSSATDCEDI